MWVRKVKQMHTLFIKQLQNQVRARMASCGHVPGLKKEERSNLDYWFDGTTIYVGFDCQLLYSPTFLPYNYKCEYRKA